MTDQQTYIRLFGLCGCVHLINVLDAFINILYNLLPLYPSVAFIYFGLFVAGIAAIIHLFLKYVW